MSFSESLVRHWCNQAGVEFPEKNGAKKEVVTRIEDEMNKVEKAFAAELESRRLAGKIQWWGYACLTLRLAKRTHFRVDFLVVLPDGSMELIDTKGAKKKKNGDVTYYAREDAKLKIKLAARMFPIFTFKIVFKDKGEWWEWIVPR